MKAVALYCARPSEAPARFLRPESETRPGDAPMAAGRSPKNCRPQANDSFSPIMATVPRPISTGTMTQHLTLRPPSKTEIVAGVN